MTFIGDQFKFNQIPTWKLGLEFLLLNLLP